MTALFTNPAQLPGQCSTNILSALEAADESVAALGSPVVITGDFGLLSGITGRISLPTNVDPGVTVTVTELADNGDILSATILNTIADLSTDIGLGQCIAITIATTVEEASPVEVRGAVVGLDVGGVEVDLFTASADILIGDIAAPVELTSFTGRWAGKSVILDWATENEIDNDGFEIQRSRNGEDWSVVDFVNAAVDEADTGTYTFIDHRPNSKMSYYRLKQMDTDGISTFSPIVTVAGRGGKAVEIYPNPTTDVLHLRPLIDATTVTEQSARIINLTGRVVFEGPLTGGTIDVSTLPQGAYILTFPEAGSSTSYRFIKR